ncbi:MAG: hypothetical protein HQM09_11460 [Candidatus Riflebacteria bacterium]|nr:hypothetical protein [Candidatus Riflebacteria bacterium]
MPRLSRTAGFWVLMFSLLGIWSFFGCGGGGGSGNDTFIAPIVQGRITGAVTASGPLGSERLPDASLIAAVIKESGADVYLELDPIKYRTRSAADGSFSLSGLPMGSHRVIAEIHVGNKVYKQCSSVIVLTIDLSEQQTGSLDLALADRKARLVLTDSSGNAITGAVMKMWGTNFTSTVSGVYESPLMPEPPSGTPFDPVILQAGGFQSVSLTPKFGPMSNPTTTEITLPKTSDTNHAPLVSMSASKFILANSEVAYMTASATDPDGDLLIETWAGGYPGLFSGATGSLYAQWTAPTFGNGQATVTFVARDPSGLSGKASVMLSYGTPNSGTDTPPVDVAITAPSTNEVLPGAMITLTGVGRDPEGGPLTYTWSVSGGSLPYGTTGDTNIWMTPNIAASVTISLAVTDQVGNVTVVSRDVSVTSTAPISDTPTVSILVPQNGGLVAQGAISFTGQASANGKPVPFPGTYLWFLSDPWPAPPQPKYQMAIERANFAFPIFVPGTYTVYFTASNTAGSATAMSVFRVNSPPSVQITGPLPANRTFALGSKVILSGIATDVEDIIPSASLTWLIGGVKVGTNSPFFTSAFVGGNNIVTLNARDSVNGLGSTSITIVMNTPPSISLISPASGSSNPAGTMVNFVASATDTEDGALMGPNNFSWQLRTGATWSWLASGSSFSTATLPDGDNYISVWALDNTPAPAQGIASLVFKYTVSPNSSPTATIASPAALSINFPMTLDLTFQGSGSDPEEGLISTYSSLRWFVATNGARIQVATGPNPTIGPNNGYSWLTGTRTLELWAYDSRGAYGTASRLFYAARLPIVTITQPVVPAGFNTGSPISFQGTAVDTLGNAISASGFNWYIDSNTTAFASNTKSFIQTTGTGLLTLGTHSIILKATDTFGFEGSASIALFINASPSAVAITSPTGSGIMFKTQAGVASFAAVRFDTNGFASFSATFADPNGAADILTTSWYCDGIRFQQTVNDQSGGTSFYSSSTFLLNSPTIGSGPHIIRFEVKDMLGMATYSEIPILIDREPHITSATCTNSIYAMGPASVPIYMAFASDYLTFVGSATDYEYGGGVTSIPNSSFTWFITAQNQNDLGGPDPKDRPATTTFPLKTTFTHGIATITFQAMDSWGIASQATFTVRIWDSVMYADGRLPESIEYVGGGKPGFLVTETAPYGISYWRLFGTLGSMDYQGQITASYGTSLNFISGIAVTNSVATFCFLETNAHQLVIATGDLTSFPTPLSDVASVGIDGNALSDNFHLPQAMDIYESGNQFYYYFADTGNNRIREVYGVDQFILWNDLANGKTISNPGNPLGSPNFLNPCGIRVNKSAADNTDYVYVCDTGQNRIVKLDKNLSYSREWSAPDPHDVAFADTSNKSWIFVSNTANNTIGVFDKNTGNSLMTFGKPGGGSGNGFGEFNAPRGIYCFDNYLFIVEKGNNRIQCIRTGYW